jgi:hypothetical protein
MRTVTARARARAVFVTVMTIAAPSPSTVTKPVIFPPGFTTPPLSCSLRTR